MPKKRKTRVVGNAINRPKPTLPEGDQGRDLAAEERQAKLAVMLKDYESEIEVRIKRLRNEGKNLLAKIRSAYSIELMQIPKHVREMKISAYIKHGAENSVSDDIVEKDDNFRQFDAKVQSAVKFKRMPLQTVNEENESGSGDKNAKRGRALRSKNTVHMPPPSTVVGGGRTVRKTRQKMFETPSQNYPPSRPGWETPLVTPKFDPRLPITPAVGRQPKPNERIMSMTGSPIYITGVHKNDMGPIDILAAIQANTNVSELKQNMDDQTMQSLQELHSKLSQFMKS